MILKMYKDIIYKCNNVDDVIEAEELAEMFGWNWSNNMSEKYSNINNVKYLDFAINLNNDEKLIYYLTVRDDNDVMEYLPDSSEHVILHDINQLKIQLRGKNFIDYNEPKKLVYENKILKFNNFKND